MLKISSSLSYFAEPGSYRTRVKQTKCLSITFEEEQEVTATLEIDGVEHQLLTETSSKDKFKYIFHLPDVCSMMYSPSSATRKDHTFTYGDIVYSFAEDTSTLTVYKAEILPSSNCDESTFKLLLEERKSKKLSCFYNENKLLEFVESIKFESLFLSDDTVDIINNIDTSSVETIELYVSSDINLDRFRHIETLKNIQYYLPSSLDEENCDKLVDTIHKVHDLGLAVKLVFWDNVATIDRNADEIVVHIVDETIQINILDKLSDTLLKPLKFVFWGSGNSLNDFILATLHGDHSNNITKVASSGEGLNTVTFTFNDRVDKFNSMKRTKLTKSARSSNSK